MTIDDEEEIDCRDVERSKMFSSIFIFVRRCEKWESIDENENIVQEKAWCFHLFCRCFQWDILSIKIDCFDVNHIQFMLTVPSSRSPDRGSLSRKDIPLIFKSPLCVSLAKVKHFIRQHFIRHHLIRHSSQVSYPLVLFHEVFAVTPGFFSAPGHKPGRYDPKGTAPTLCDNHGVLRATCQETCARQLDDQVPDVEWI
jgi:hypothetical protein